MKGVYIISSEFIRGIDFKLQHDAEVIVLVNGELSLDLSDIL